MMCPSRFWRAARVVCVAALGCIVLPSVASAAVRYLIIHADDAGMSHSVNDGTLEAMVNGFVSSASIMVPCPGFEGYIPGRDGFAEIALSNPHLDWGIHLTLTSEFGSYGWGPFLGAAEVPSLVDPDTDRLWKSVAQVAANADAAEVDRELRAQIDRALELGIRLTHLDTHMGANAGRPDLLELYVQLGIDYNLPVLFPGLGAYDSFDHIWNPDDEWWTKWEGGEPGFRAADLAQRLEDAGLPMLDKLLQFHCGCPDRDQIYLNAIESLRELPPGSVGQLIIHCGINDEELQGITGSAPWRDFDRLFFQDPDVLDQIEGWGIEIITWKEYHDLFSPDPGAIPEPNSAVVWSVIVLGCLGASYRRPRRRRR